MKAAWFLLISGCASVEGPCTVELEAEDYVVAKIQCQEGGKFSMVTPARTVERVDYDMEGNITISVPNLPKKRMLCH